MLSSRNSVFTKISFILLAVVAAALAVMTAGVYAGWSDLLYSSWPMVILWALTALFAIISICCCRLIKRPILFLLHISFVIILIGAGVTHFFSSEGYVHLRIDSDSKDFQSEDYEGMQSLLSDLQIADFEIVTYPGTNTPCDFKAHVISENSGSEVGINSPGKLCGYIFTMESYDEDLGGVTFKVSRDPWGKGISYAGYLLLGLSFVGYFFTRGSVWRGALRKLTACVMMAASVLAGSAETKVTEQFSDLFSDIVIEYNGRLSPVATVAGDFTSAITGGGSSYKGMDADRILAGFLFDFGNWKSEPIIKIKSKELREMLNLEGGYASYEQIFDAIASDVIDINDPGFRKKFSVDIDRFESINMLISGEILKLFPVEGEKGVIYWYSPVDKLPAELSTDQWLFIRKFMGLLNEKIAHNDLQGQKSLLEGLERYQKKILGDSYPSPGKIRLEKAYNYLLGQRYFAPVMVIAGFCMYILLLSGSGFSEKRRLSLPLKITGIGLTAAVFIIVTLMFVLRWSISGHVPLSNGYETMHFLTWLLLLIGILFGRQRLMILAMSILAGGLTMSVAVMGSSGSSVTGLMPVLNSPLLSVHVVLVMGAYALFLLMALTGVAGLIAVRAKKYDADRYMSLIYVMIYPAVALLAFGIFIGAIWADISWGRYWGWDPKEVWALITLLIYSFALHPRVLRLFSSPVALMLFSILAFCSVLITYFGVNFILGGLHGYV